MPLHLVYPADRRVAYTVPADPPRFGHRLGGGREYAGLTPPAGGPDVHLLFRLNTADPAVGTTLPNATWLPLLVALRYGACDLGYRVESDTAVRILSLGEAVPWPNFPTPDYPAVLPEIPVELASDGYNPDDPASAWVFSGVFGTAHLTPAQLAGVERLVTDSGEYELFRESDEQTVREFVSGNTGGPYTQGRPTDPCPDTACPNRAKPGVLRTFALYVAGGAFARTLWGPDGAGIQLVYQMCPACHAIRVTNQAT